MAKRLTFTDVRTGKEFTTSKYKLRTINTKRGKRKQAVADAPSGGKAVRFVSMDFSR